MSKPEVIYLTNAVCSILFGVCSFAVGLLGIWLSWRSEMRTIPKD